MLGIYILVHIVQHLWTNNILIRTIYMVVIFGNIFLENVITKIYRVSLNCKVTDVDLDGTLQIYHMLLVHKKVEEYIPFADALLG